MANSRVIIGQITRERQSDYTTIAGGGGAVTMEIDGPPGLGIKRELAERAGLRSGFHILKPVDLTTHGSTCTLKFLLHGPVVSAADPTANTPAEGGFLEQIMGSLYTGGYFAAEVVAGSSAALVNVSLFSHFKAGSASIYTDGTSYAMGFTRVATNAATDTVEPVIDLSLTPATNSTVYGTHTYYNSTAALAFDTIIMNFEAPAAEITLEGCFPTSVKLTGGMGKCLMMEVTLHVRRVTETVGAAPAEGSYTYSVLPPMDTSSKTYLYVDNGTTGTEIPLTSFEFTATLEPVFTGLGNSGVIVKNRTQELKYSRPIDDSPIIATEQTNASPNALQLVHGTAPGGMFGLIMVKPVLVEAPTGPNDKDGLWSQDYTYRSGYVTGDLPSTDAPANSSCRIALG